LVQTVLGAGQCGGKRIIGEIVVPPFFNEDDIENLDQIKSSVLEHEVLSHAVGAISLYPNLQDIFAFPNRAVSYLNRLLHDTALFRQFVSLTLPSQTKTKNGRTWVESREIPPAASPDLGIYQARRLNRLILEKVLAVLPKASYLATFHVADAILKNVCHRGLTIARVRVYGHPAHVERCRIQTLESAWKIGLRLNPSQVDVIPCGDAQLADPSNWDPDNAQEWVQSWNNWKEHEGI
jgi:hypothetical protein